jgi:heptosyltransferase-2
MLLTNPVPLPEWKDERHESFYYLNIVNELSRAVHETSPAESTDLPYQLAVSTARQNAARDCLRNQGVEGGAPLVVLCPGSVNSRAKRWPADRFAAVADQFIESGTGVALIGSRAELDVSVEVRQHMRHAPIVLTGKTTVAEAVAIISVADVLIANDTGPAHIGSAVGTPTLVIFGPTNPLTTRPFAPNAEIVRHRPDCAPCMLRDCPIDHRCMTAISADEVIERARALMSDRLQFVVAPQTESIG